MNNKYNLKPWAIVLLMSAILPGLTVNAQEDDEEYEEESISIEAPDLEEEASDYGYEFNPLEEVLVTARKREESLQEIPIAITVLTDAAMESRGFTSVEDIAGATPGFSFESFSTGGTYGNPVIRGLTNTFTTGRVQNVSFFLDGIYLQRQSMLNMGLIDMQRIEVVKGPQSAAYGRNAFAGAVNYITSRVENDFAGYALTTQGDNGRQDYRFTASGALGSPAWLGKVSWGKSIYDGHSENFHPLADIDVAGPSTHSNLGGWDDETISLRLIFAPMDTMEMQLGYYSTEAEREPSAFFTLGGFGATRFEFRTEEQNDLNCNFFSGATQGGDPVSGNSAWCGELPKEPDPSKRLVAGNAVVDPRGIGALLDTDVITFKVDWESGDNWVYHYLFGLTDHNSFTNGGSGDEDSMLGTRVMWTSVNTDAGQLRDYRYANTFSGRPNSDLLATSHEFRVDWLGNDNWLATFGAYYSFVDDEQWETLYFMPTCSNVDIPGPFGNGTADDEVANCLLRADGKGVSPLAIPEGEEAPEGLVEVTTDFARQHELKLAHVEYEDDVKSIFGTVSYMFNDSLVLAAEARYTEENKKIHRISDQFGLTLNDPPGLSPLTPTAQIGESNSKEKFTYFTPRLILEWSITEETFVYFSAAKGIKTGGFNNISVVCGDSQPVDENGNCIYTPAQQQILGQTTYDTEENWNYEMGVKNTFMGGFLTLNGALYYIDWTGIQGNRAPVDDTGGVNNSVIIDNIGDAESIGFELETVWHFHPKMNIDAGYAFNEAKLKDGVIYQEGALYYKFGCSVDPCPADIYGDVGGNYLPRTSKHQFTLGLNFRSTFENGWMLDGRLDTSYQSKQYTDQLNISWVPARTIFNTNISIQGPEHWNFSVWAKNLLDEEYVSSSFMLALFNRYIITSGARRSVGATVKYEF